MISFTTTMNTRDIPPKWRPNFLVEVGMLGVAIRELLAVHLRKPITSVTVRRTADPAPGGNFLLTLTVNSTDSTVTAPAVRQALKTLP